MKTALSVLKVNALSLLAFPLLVISMAIQLVQKALGKLLVFLGAGVALLLMAGLNAFINNPWAIIEGWAAVAVLAIFFGIFTVLVALLIHFLGAMIVTAVATIARFLNGLLSVVFELSNRAYSSLYDTCQFEIDDLQCGTEGKIAVVACVCWHFLNLFHKLVVLVFSHAFPISIAAAVGFAGYLIFTIHHSISPSFGIGIWSYLRLFPVVNAVFAVLEVLVILSTVVTVLLALGEEWNKWGNELQEKQMRARWEI